MHICLVSEEYPPDTGWGGIGTYTYNLAHGLSARGHDVCVLSSSVNEVGSEALDGSVKVVRLPRAEPPEWLRRFDLGGLVHARIRYRRVHGYLQEHDSEFDIIEFPLYNAEGILYLRGKSRKPTVVRGHTGHIGIEQGRKGRLMGGNRLIREEAESARLADLFVANSQYSLDLGIQEYGLSAETCRVCYHGVELPSAGGTDDGRTVLFVGRLEERKGARYLLEAIPLVLKQVPDARFRLVGSGGEELKRQYTASWRPDTLSQVEFLGHQSGANLETAYRNCSIMAAPSLIESFGFVHAEAMSYGKPVVAFDASATKEVVEHCATGLLVLERDSTALAEAIVQLLKDPDLRGQMGAAARRRVEDHFTLDRMAESVEAIYLELLQSRI